MSNKMTKVDTNNKKSVERLDKNYLNECNYLFKFYTMEEAVIFSALVYSVALAVITDTDDRIILEINAAPSLELLNLCDGPKKVYNKDVYSFRKDTFIAEPTVYIKGNFSEQSEVVKTISKLLDKLYTNEQEMGDYINQFNTSFYGNADFLIDVLGCIRCNEFRSDFLRQKVLASRYFIDKENNGNIVIAFVSPLNDLQKNIKALRSSTQLLQHRFDDTILKQYRTEYEFDFEFLHDFSPPTCVYCGKII